MPRPWRFGRRPSCAGTASSRTRRLEELFALATMLDAAMLERVLFFEAVVLQTLRHSTSVRGDSFAWADLLVLAGDYYSRPYSFDGLFRGSQHSRDGGVRQSPLRPD